MYILDDPLSAVDAVVGRRLFQTCMSGVLKDSIIVLVTHHLQYAKLADAMLVIDQVCTMLNIQYCKYDYFQKELNVLLYLFDDYAINYIVFHRGIAFRLKQFHLSSKMTFNLYIKFS